MLAVFSPAEMKGYSTDALPDAADRDALPPTPTRR